MERFQQDSRFSVHVKAIILDDKKRILLLRHKPNQGSISQKERWSLPTGYLEFEDNAYNAVWKAVYNQTGLEVDVLNPTNVWTLNKNSYMHILGITFHCAWSQKEFLKAQMELLEKKTLSKEEKYPINLAEEYVDYAWTTAKTILEGEYPVWLKEEIAKLSGKRPRQDP